MPHSKEQVLYDVIENEIIWGTVKEHLDTLNSESQSMLDSKS